MWKQQARDLSDYSIMNRFERIFMEAGGPIDCALFVRRSGDKQIFLISPSAAKWAPLLGGVWEDAPDALDHRWSLLVADVRDLKSRFGIKIGADD